jgi:hypothetical protein
MSFDGGHEKGERSYSLVKGVKITVYIREVDLGFVEPEK